METNQVLKEMLLENTGRALCDSGGDPQYNADGRYIGSKNGYGRGWERNIGREFDEELPTIVDFKYGIEVTHNLYHFLSERLSFDEPMTNLFYKFAELPENEEKNYMDLEDLLFEWVKTEYIEKGNFPEDLPFTENSEIKGLYGEGPPMTENTYNHECLLSQTIQYTYFEIDGDPYVILYIHNGADVRGGYTKPRIFNLDEKEVLFDTARATIYCENDPSNHQWDTEEGYCFRSSVGDDLDDFEIIKTELDPKETTALIAKKIVEIKADEKQEQLPEFGEKISTLDVIHVDDEGNGYCPICGGKLSASVY